MGLEIFNENDAKLWDDIVSSAPHGTLYHSWKWLKLIEKHCQCKLFPLVFFDARDRQPFGILPVFLMKKLGLKMVFSPPPGSAVNLGPVLADKGYRQHKTELATWISRLPLINLSTVWDPAIHLFLPVRKNWICARSYGRNIRLHLFTLTK